MRNEPLLGKYRGVVANNADPLRLGRLQAVVPDVTGVQPTTWAMPCMPFAGSGLGMFAVPPVGSGVWIEFEQGDPDYPIWVGCYWGDASELPALAQNITPPVSGAALQSLAGNGLVISDLPGPDDGVLLTHVSGATICLSATGITIRNGQGASIELNGNVVAINGEALVIV